MKKKERIARLAEHVGRREQEYQTVMDRLREFTTTLYCELESALVSFHKRRGESVEEVIHRKDVGDELESFSFDWNRGRVILVPVPDAALPSTDFQLPHGEGLVGRIIVFYEVRAGSGGASPVCEIYIHQSGAWSAAGVNIPLVAVTSESEVISGFALTLLESLTYNIQEHHTCLEESDFDPETMGTRPSVGFRVFEKRE